MDLKHLTGSAKVAILTNAIGEQAAKPLLDRLNPAERGFILNLQSKLRAVPTPIVEKVIREFLERSGHPVPGEAGQLNNAAKQHGADEQKLKRPRSNIEAVQDIAPGQLAQVIKDEHPQTIALILVHLKPNVASTILSHLSDEVKSEVAFRIASLDKVQSGMVQELDRIFGEILKNKDDLTQEAGGVARLAEILNASDVATAERILEEIEGSNSELADEIKQMMFVFDDIVLVDDKGLQKVLRSVGSDELAVALKASTEEVKQKIFRNMSERAAEILKEEMEVCRAVRMKNVTDAQQKITRIVQELERKGELIISGRNDEELFR